MNLSIKIFLIIVNSFFLCSAQIPGPSSQLKITYSLEYTKVPFKMKLFKKHMPRKLVQYHSILGSRSEVNVEIDMLGDQMTNSTTSVINESESKIWTKTLTVVNDSIVQDEFLEKSYKPNKSDNIIIGHDTKNILGYKCVVFSLENDSSITTGFLAPEIIVSGDFKNYGLPLEFESKSKKDKLIVITKAEKITIEPLDNKTLLLTDE